MSAHKCIEVSRRFVEGRYGARVVEVLYGCTCDSFADVAIGVTLREARHKARAAVREHAALVELTRAQQYRRMIELAS